MNIFVLDSHPKTAAEYHCDRHVVKMILESAQMLCTAHHILGDIDKDLLYRKTHPDHPCTKWVTESKENYEWLYRHFVGLCDVYTFRYDKIHKTETKLKELLSKPPKNIKNIGLTPFALAMPEEYKTDDAVESYRNYYMGEKQHIAVWTKSPTPEWFEKATKTTKA